MGNLDRGHPAEDTKKAVEMDGAGIILTNHGGRQLDSGQRRLVCVSKRRTGFPSHAGDFSPGCRGRCDFPEQYGDEPDSLAPTWVTGDLLEQLSSENAVANVDLVKMLTEPAQREAVS
ncbi:hypothetical protein CERZMDRAFT_101229 [Cercospora zeae-maydis SCOH1-5]|uniref:FMN-dependent dehydrogenase domain-containing protein n=1 Tax=Cercospora zeae-maydis SCOH1-5 TaxID=717836 RepID=A0A6A6F5I2_9PEZI|nr:hypothetical protein CERZMDRAFT_101229 [Cercospora zeae-maydis SCOH1-5]